MGFKGKNVGAAITLFGMGLLSGRRIRKSSGIVRFFCLLPFG